MLSSHEEYAFSLNQYMVVLEKPIGLTLAPDPATGDVYVQEIQEGLSAAESRLVLVGDKLLLCSAVFGDEMWRASDLQRTRWAINNRPGKVKLVLERSNGEPLPAWYFRGKEGVASWEVPELQLPIRFVTPVGGELSESVAGAGRCLAVSFSRCLSPAVLPADQARRTVRQGAAARRARAEAVLAQLAAAAEAPDVELPNPVVRLLPRQAGYQVAGSPLPPSQNVLPFRRPPQPQPQPQQHNAAGGSPLAAPGSNSAQPPQSNSNSSNSSNNNSSSNSSGGSVSAGGDYVPVRQQNSSGTGSGGSSQQQQQQQQQPAGEAAAAAAAAAAAPSPPANGGATSSSSSSRSGPGPGKKVIQLLPWLLVSHGRLSGPELVHLAATRALTCLLELGLRLEPEAGLLCPRGAVPPAYEPPVLPVPPTLSPSSIPTPAPANPPPFPPGQQPQQQEAAAAAAAAAAEAGQQQQQGEGQQGEAGGRQAEGEGDGQGSSATTELLVAAGLAGIAGPDTGFASAAVAAAAAAAAVEAGAEAAERQQQQQDGGGDAGSSSGDGSGDAAAVAAADQQPSHVTLQAHHLLYCMADLQRLAVRRHWLRRRSAPSGSSSSSSGLPPLQPPLQQQPHFQQQQQQQHYGSQLLLTCDEGSWPAVGLLLAAWLHWHCGLELAVAVEAVGGALGVTLDTSVLVEARRLLVVRAKERFSRLLLTWPYGGLSAEVSGELLGGWTERVAMKRCLKPEGCLGVDQGLFYLELAGLHPGRYHYKYIIDNTWAVDPLAPKALDSQGNWNNVLEVAPPPAIATPQEQEHFAALQAACAAFEAKAAPPRRRQQ